MIRLQIHAGQSAKPPLLAAHARLPTFFVREMLCTRDFKSIMSQVSSHWLAFHNNYIHRQARLGKCGVEGPEVVSVRIARLLSVAKSEDAIDYCGAVSRENHISPPV